MALTGCRSWFPPEEKKTSSPFASIAMPPGSVAVEVALAEFSSTKLAEILGEISPFIDRQKISIGERQQWDRNGLQVGVIASDLPGALRDALEPRSLTPSELEAAQIKLLDPDDELPEISPILTNSRMQFRAGEPKSVPVSDYYPFASWNFLLNNSRSAGADQNVRGWIKVATQLGQGDSVDLNIVPRITHGPLQRNVDVIDHALAYKQTQSETNFHQIPVNVSLRPGETIVIWGESSSAEVGDLLFGTPEGQNPKRQRILLLRVVQTQHDDLFRDNRLK